MVKVIDKKAALSVFYYLMSIDGVTSFEEEKFQELGTELLGDGFNEIKEDVISDCRKRIDSITAEDVRYDVILEGIDNALGSTVKKTEEGVVPRLLIWDMLILAYCDGDYSEDENRVISHVARVLEIDKSVLPEMKQLVETAESVRKEKLKLEKSLRPYAKIKPLIDECDKRIENILDAAKNLISDDYYTDEEAKPKKEKKMVRKAGKKLEEADSQENGHKVRGELSSSKKIGEKTLNSIKNTTSLVSDKAKQGMAGIKDGTGKLFAKKKENSKIVYLKLPDEYEKIEEKLPDDMGMPENAVGYRMLNKYTRVLLVSYPVSEEISMDFNDLEGLIKSLHEENIDEHTGIIEVKAGTAKNGGKYIYHMLKRSNDSENGLPVGNVYSINLNIQVGNTIQFICGNFLECGTTGLRDNMIWAMLYKEGKIGSDFEGWSRDPYDSDFKKGFLMNLSEQEIYDEMFPEHPLSVARRLAKYVIESN